MRDFLVFAVLVGVSVGCGTSPSGGDGPLRIGTAKSAIISGTLDSGDPAVVELFYIVGLSPSACDGGASCSQSCFDSTGQSCTSGATCLCEIGATCTGELVGPRSVVTAGHCTDLAAGGTLSGPEGPALTLCTSPADVMALSAGTAPSSGCNVAAYAIFNNRCTSTDAMESCERALIQNGDYIIADAFVNPGYDAHTTPFPDSSADTDNDIGLVRLSSSTLENGAAEPDLLVFNRADLGAQCNDLGGIRSVGYGITEPSQGASALSGLKYQVSHDTKVRDAWHIEADGAQADTLQVCGAGAGEEPTCMGDSGGPAFDSAGHIVGVTSYGDETCSTIGVSTRTDAYASWIDTTMASWGDPKNGTVVRADSGAAASDSGASPPPPSMHDADASVAADASMGDDGSLQEAGTQAATLQASASGGCAVTRREGSRSSELAPLLILGAAFVRRRRREG